MAEEIYIREPGSESSKGPYTIDQLVTLAEAKQIIETTEYYDDDKEEWLAFENSKDVQEQVFPVSKKLKLKTGLEEEIANAAPKAVEETKVDDSITVTDMLAAAEGKTDDTKFLKNQAARREKAMSLLPSLLGFCLLLSGITLLLIQCPDLLKGDFSAINLELIKSNPLLIIASFDLVTALITFLAVTAFFPLIRIRALVLTGYLSFNYYSDWTNGAEITGYVVLALLIYNLGLYAMTMTRNLHFLILSFIATVASISSFAYIELAPLFLK